MTQTHRTSTTGVTERMTITLSTFTDIYKDAAWLNDEALKTGVMFSLPRWGTMSCDVMWCYHVMSCDALWCHVPWCDPYCIVQTIRLTPSLWTPGPSPPAPPTSSQWRREELTGDRSQCFTGVRSVLKSGPALMRMSQILHFCPDNRLAQAERTKMTLFKGLKF